MPLDDLPQILNLQEKIAKELKLESIKNILALYRASKTMREIAIELFSEHEIGVATGVVCHVIQSTLSEDEKMHLKGRGAQKQMKKGIGIHGQSLIEKSRAGQAGALASGGTPYSADELVRLEELINSPDYKLGTRINSQRIAEVLNTEFHDGDTVRSSENVRQKISRLRQDIKKKVGALLPVEK